jgi:glycosyltransferase involved in cell wall biosynthesis
MVFEAHTPPVHCLQRWVEGWVYRQRHFRGLVVISEALRREYSRLYPGLGGDRVVVAHDATDPVESRGGCEHRDAWPGRAGHLQVGYVGHLYNGRGIDLMLTLAAVLTTMDFHLVGGMEKDIDRWRRSCRSANVHFHGFRLPRDIHRYFERFDVLLAPYQARVFSVGGRKEITRWMSPLKIFDYMMAGKAMVCTDLPVLREILTDRVNALLVPAGDVAAWTRAISSLAEDARLRAALGQRARRQVLAHHTWQQRAASLCAFLQIPAGVP